MRNYYRTTNSFMRWGIGIMTEGPDAGVWTDIGVVINNDRVATAIEKNMLINDGAIPDLHVPEIQDPCMEQYDARVGDPFVEHTEKCLAKYPDRYMGDDVIPKKVQKAGYEYLKPHRGTIS